MRSVHPRSYLLAKIFMYNCAHAKHVNEISIGYLDIISTFERKLSAHDEHIQQQFIDIHFSLNFQNPNKMTVKFLYLKSIKSN